MFESPEVLDRCTGTELATLIEDIHRDLVRHENRALVLAAAWADLHDVDPAEPYAPLIHRMRAVGGDGTPEVSEYAAAELGARQGWACSRRGARSLPPWTCGTGSRASGPRSRSGR